MQKLLEAYDKDALKKINEICEQLIKYNAIIQEGKFDINQIDNNKLKQGYSLEIDKEFKEIKPSNEKYLESSHKILGLDYKKKNEYLQRIKDISSILTKEKLILKKRKLLIE